jgi:SAM-dependent methyltransferase
MEPSLPSDGFALDIGSQHGWFTFKLAERGLYALGIDSARRSVRISQSLALYNGPGRAALLRARIEPESTAHLPSADVGLFMSVFHHLVRKNSLDYATETTAGIVERCRGQMYFETGQSDDTNHKWALELEFMGDSPKQWITGFLLSLGFDRVEHVGDTLGHRDGSRPAVWCRTVRSHSVAGCCG